MRFANPSARIFGLLACLGAAVAPAAAKNGSEPLNHYSLASLNDSAIGGRLMGRFKAKGQPVFLIHDARLGLAQGDIMRFQDKAVLVDADVWQTLREEGALERMKGAPVLRVQGKASAQTWDSRSSLVSDAREKKAYAFGAELLKILEETFGGVPARDQMALIFDGSNLVLMAPDAFIDRLQYAEVKRALQPGRPVWITPPPPPVFAGKELRWQVWAADPAEPSGALRYSLGGTLPTGLSWSAPEHAIRGTPADTGRWPLSIQVRNGTGGAETLEFAFEVRNNRPPRLAREPRMVAVAGQEWVFAADAIDPDHPGGEVRILPREMPPGMAFDSSARRFSWRPGEELAGSKADFALRLEDRDGAACDTAFALSIIPAAEMLWSEGIRPSLPWDTLVQGRTYVWEAGASALAWARQGIVLAEAEGDAFTRFEGDSLVIIPARAGTHVLRFSFEVQGNRTETEVVLPVRPDLPPRFASEVGSWRVLTGRAATFRPVAIDDGGDPVRIAALETGPGLEWDGERLRLEAAAPGLHAARLVAVDPAGHAAEQWVAFRVDPADRGVAWFLENRLQAGLSALSLSADFGTGRIGLFLPSLDRVGREGPSGARSWPYLTFGGNLMGREAETRGRRLWVDAGITLRLPDPKIATGGVMTRILGEWTYPGQAFGRIEFEFQGYVNQALVVADTSNLQVIFGDEVLRFADRFDGVVDGIIREATARDNMVLLSRLEAWSRLGAGFWGGPGIWREDLPNANRFDQFLGGGLRYQARLSDAMAIGTLRLGWGSGAGWNLNWTGRLSLNSPF